MTVPALGSSWVPALRNALLLMGLSLACMSAYAESENTQDTQQAPEGDAPLLIILPNPVPSREQANPDKAILAAPANPCALRSRSFDKAACRAATQNRTPSTRAMLKPRIPENSWRAANHQLTSNLEWY